MTRMKSICLTETKARGKRPAAKRLAVCAILLAMVLILSGCMKMHIDIVWNADNSASVSMTVAVMKSMLTMMETSEDEIRQQFREGMEGDGSYTFKDYSDKEFTGIVATLHVADITKGSPDSIDGLIFRSSGEGKSKTYTVTGSISGSDITGDNDELTGIDIDMKLSIQMPGKVTSHNAAEQRGNTLTWSLLDASASSIQATSTGGAGGGMTWLWIVIGVVVLAGVIVVVLMLARKKKAVPQAGQYAPNMMNNAYGNPAPVIPPQQPYYQAPVAPPQQPPYQAPVAPPQQPMPVAQQGQAPGAKFCATCGVTLNEGTKFCTSCGAAT